MGTGCCGGGAGDSTAAAAAATEQAAETAAAAMAAVYLGKDGDIARKSWDEVVADKTPYYHKRVQLFEQYRARDMAALEAAKAAAVPINVVLPGARLWRRRHTADAARLLLTYHVPIRMPDCLFCCCLMQ